MLRNCKKTIITNIVNVAVICYYKPTEDKEDENKKKHFLEELKTAYAFRRF